MSTPPSPGADLPGTPSEQVMPDLTHRQILTVLVGLMLGMLVAALSQTIVATALPTIVGELGGQDQLAWVVLLPSKMRPRASSSRSERAGAIAAD